MEVGSLNRRVTIQQRVPGQGPIGQPLRGWVDVATVNAGARNPTGSAAIKAGVDSATVRTSYRIRWRTGIDASMRLVDRATIYDIKQVLPDLARKEYVDLVCEVTA